MTKNLADELGPRGVNVTVVHPGMTRTERTPEAMAAMAQSRGTTVEELERALEGGVSIGRLVTAEEVARSWPSWPAPRASPSTATPSPPAAARAGRSTTEEGPEGARVAGEGFEPSKACHSVYSRTPLTAREPRRGGQRV